MTAAAMSGRAKDIGDEACAAMGELAERSAERNDPIGAIGSSRPWHI